MIKSFVALAGFALTVPVSAGSAAPASEAETADAAIRSEAATRVAD